MGATVALPFLDAMIPALSAAPKTPLRFGAVYFPCGVWPGHWQHPDAEGADFAFKPVMQPLEPFRNQLVTVSKMKALAGRVGPFGSQLGLLNGVACSPPRWARRLFRQNRIKKTVDQFIADQVPCSARRL